MLVTVMMTMTVGVGERAKRASLEEDLSDESRKIATDGYIHY